MTRVRHLHLLLGLTCLAAAVAVLGAAAGFWATPPPGLYSDRAEIDFGELAQMDVVTGRFRLVNRHPEPIRVAEVLTGCSCTEWAATPRDILPKGRTDLSIKWSVGQRRGRLTDAVSLIYQTSDGKRRRVELFLSATVIPDIHYEPPVLTFDPAKATEAVVRFSPGRRDPFVLERAVVNQSAFRAVVGPEGDRVVVTFDPASWVGIGADPILSVSTDSPREPTIRIPLRVSKPNRDGESDRIR